jgi:hypothetical protein
MLRRVVVSAMVLIPCLFSQDASPPKLPYFDWKACPFETCSYGEWTARKPIAVYDTWEEKRHEIARIVEGEKVLAETGVVITLRPGIIRMDRDLPEQKLKRGETLLTYSYRGEGFSAVSVHGKYESDFDISFTKWPDGTGCGSEHCAATYVDLGSKVWWVKVKLASGRTGWLNTEGADFDCER